MYKPFSVHIQVIHWVIVNERSEILLANTLVCTCKSYYWDTWNVDFNNDFILFIFILTKKIEIMVGTKKVHLY